MSTGCCVLLPAAYPRGPPYLRAGQHQTLPAARSPRAGTFLHGVVHTVQFLVPRYRPTVPPGLAVIASELHGPAWIRRRFCVTGLLTSLISVTLGGAISVSLGTVR